VSADRRISSGNEIIRLSAESRYACFSVVSIFTAVLTFGYGQVNL
jgi:hypothetical protein